MKMLFFFMDCNMCDIQQSSPIATHFHDHMIHIVLQLVIGMVAMALTCPD